MQETHSGHRKRLKNKVETYGFESLYPHEMLEFILFASMPRKDTNHLAHKLINTFGSYEDVFTSTREALLAVEGIGPACVLQLKSYHHHANRILGIEEQKYIRTIGEAKSFFKSDFKNKKTEEFHMVLLDKDGIATNHEIYTDCKSEKVIVPVDDIMQMIAARKPHYVMFAHNHPSGNANPSEKDFKFTTKLLANIEKYFGITNCEHLIFSGKNCYSFRHNGFITD